MKRLALISSLNNAEQRGGAYLRVHALVKIYQQLGFEVTIFYMEQFSPKKQFRGLLFSICFQANLQILFSKATVDVRGFDYVHYDNLRFFQWDILRDPSTKVIYNAHNLEFESYYPRKSSWGKRMFAQYEANIINCADFILVCSQREKLELQNLKVESEKIFVIPNLIEQENYYAADNKNKILFLGTLDYYPNIRAVDFLCSSFFPNIPKHTWQDYEFVIAGRNPSLAMEHRVTDLGITLRKNLTQQEIYTLLAETYISLVPLDHGSGTRLKIVESIFSKAFILATPMGAEGFTASEVLLLAELEDFSRRFLELIKMKKSFGELDRVFLQHNDLTQWYLHYEQDLRNFLQVDNI